MKIKLFIVAMASIFIFGCSDALDMDRPVSKNQVFTLANTPIANEGIASLRGVHSIRHLSADPIKNKVIKAGDFDVSFDDQPPLIPHKSDYMRVTIKSNRCLTCHSNANYREEEAAKMPSSHFKTRSGKRLKTVSPRRYFCKQCHVSQVDAPPLVGNTYINTDE